MAALKATCLSFGEAFAADAVVPQLHAAAGIPAWSSPAPAAGPAAGSGPDSAAWRDEQCRAQLHTRLAEAGLLAAPATSAQLVLQTPTALALLLAGALPYAGASAVGACLRRLCTDGGSGSGSVWALQHPRAFVAAVRSAAEVQLVQVRLLPPSCCPAPSPLPANTCCCRFCALASIRHSMVAHVSLHCSL